jgi:hypothetical protein
LGGVKVRLQVFKLLDYRSHLLTFLRARRIVSGDCQRNPGTLQ